MNRADAFVPKSILCLRDYSIKTFLADLVAGLTVGLVSLPLAMAFAISSGLAPQAGIYTAVVAGFLISALGGSKTQIGGPTGAFVVVVAGIVARHGIDGLFMCTLMAGVILVILGLTGLGTAIKYIRDGFAHSLQTNPMPEGVAVYRIHGPFLFGATDKLAIIDEQFDALPSVVVLRLRNMNATDATGLHALENLAERLVKSGRHLILCGMRDQPAKLMAQAEFHQHIGEANLCRSLTAAVVRAKQLLAC